MWGSEDDLQESVSPSFTLLRRGLSCLQAVLCSPGQLDKGAWTIFMEVSRLHLRKKQAHEAIFFIPQDTVRESPLLSNSQPDVLDCLMGGKPQRPALGFILTDRAAGPICGCSKEPASL